jgi:hypothetical protein
MKFLNPWIDPRVAQIRSAAAQAYLRSKGWKPLTTTQPNLLPFDSPVEGDESTVAIVPVQEQGRDYTQRMIELITAVALFENRYAPEVVSDMLGQALGSTAIPNGPATLRQEKPPVPVHS